MLCCTRGPVVCTCTPRRSVLFDGGNAARVFLCAPYRVRTTAAIGAESPAPGRVVLSKPVAALPGDCRAWGCVRRNCPAGDPP